MKLRLFHIFLIIGLCAGFSFAGAQTNDWRSHLEQLAEAEEELDDATVENMYQELTMLEANPMNLNTVSRGQLERFPLLTFEQATNLADFLERNRPVYTVFELRNVSYLDFNTVELILPFFFVGETEKTEPTVREMLKHGRNEVQLRFDKTLNKRAGYGEFSDSILQRFPNRKYRGEDFYTSLKYSFAYRDKIQFGLLGEKDAGEPFFKKDYPKGYDHYGFHLIVRDMGKLRTLAVGDYRLSFGQGLILNNDFSLPKAWATNNLIRRTQGPKRHFSTAENGFFRGAAAVFQIDKVSVTAFYSNKRFDANLSNDGFITSFKIDGYHRTPGEMEKRNNAREQVTGVNINYRKEQFQIGLSGIYHAYNRTYHPTVQEYNYYYLRDSSNMNASIDYSYRFRRLSFAGEAAMAKNKAVATTNMLQYSPSNLLSLSVLYRYFPISYNAMHARAFSETARVQNESGLYVGATFSPLRRISVTSYIDVFRFPWVRSQVDKPSKGVELYVLSTYTVNRNSNIELRYRYKQREQNARYPDENSRAVLPQNTQKIRLRYNNTLNSGWNFRTTLDAALYSQKHFPQETGYMLSQNIGYRGSDKIRGDFYAGYFSSESFAARLYSYERNILSTFYMPSFYGEGMRLALSGRYDFTSRLSFSVKMGHTRYFNRETIGSGTELIDGNSRTDVFTYLRWRF
ncbi:MAG: helix-hairpin-helix domain-containing protein [Bacteroidia bacterium]|nr:helix-hairpin-helix domain-containing protein [Bacteroidia bacterium]